jgi:arylsulfatase A-like enzyme
MKKWLTAIFAVLSCSNAIVFAQPNVIVVITDDQGYGDLACHGHPALKTPNLDRLHSQSVRLTDFHACPMCTPTRGQLLTGIDCLRNGAMNVSSGRSLLRRGIPTLGNFFSDAGYRTGQFGKWHLGDNYPYRPEDRGFQETLSFPSSHIGSANDFWNNDYFDDTYIQNGKRKLFPGYCTDVFFRESVKWMKECAQKKQPFFCYLATNAPHAPLFVDQKYRAKYAEKFDFDTSRFFGMIENIDDNFGALDLFLKEQGILEDTILVFLSDNGGTVGVPIFNAGMRGHKTELWDGGHRVPGFIRWPKGKLRAGQDIAELTTVQDIAPTLCELANIKTQTTFDGISLAAELRTAKKVPDRKVVVQFSRMDRPKPAQGDAVLLWKTWRLIKGQELYDVATDPLQNTNLIKQKPEIAQELQDHYAKWWSGVEAKVNDFEAVIIGSKHENPTMLSATEWADVFLDQAKQVREGVKKNGTWHLEVAEDGEYDFELRRWPAEAKAAISAGLPKHEHFTMTFPEGVALPITTARISIGGKLGTALSKPVSPKDEVIKFTTKLKAGRITLRTAFLNDQDQELCGAYYVSITNRKAG